MAAVHLTTHGLKSLKQRVGIPKRAARRHIERVMQEGIREYKHHDARMRRWSTWAHFHYSANVFYWLDDYVYIFKREGEGDNMSYTLITVLYRPHSGPWEN